VPLSLLVPRLLVPPLLVPLLVPLHMGALHAYEAWGAVLLGVGPFVVLAVVVAVLRRRDRREDDGE
jgi:hypothetical protein